MVKIAFFDLKMTSNDDLESHCQTWIDPITGDSLVLQSSALNIANEIDKARSTR